GAAFLDAADEAGVVVIDLLLQLAAGQHDLLGVDDDDIVTAVDMGRVARLVLAAQPQRDDRGEAADDQALPIDHHPLLLDFGRLGRIGLHWVASEIVLRTACRVRRRARLYPAPDSRSTPFGEINPSKINRLYFRSNNTLLQSFGIRRN